VSTPPHHRALRPVRLILLGESLLASANAIIEAPPRRRGPRPLTSISILALVVTASLWWIYSWPPHQEAISSFGSSLRYGYVHYFVFAAAGALSAALRSRSTSSPHSSKSWVDARCASANTLAWHSELSAEQRHCLLDHPTSAVSMVDRNRWS
jgi:hypothetical protein